MTNANIDLLDSVEASSHAITDVLKILSVDRDRGLPASEIERRRQQYGWNRLQQLKRRSNWQIALEQFKSPIVGLLAVAAILSFSFQEWVEGIAILIAILLNAGIGFVTEVKAVNSMESLQRLSRTYAKVRRDGRVQEIPSEEIVLGDIVVFEGGDLVPADLRILEASKLQADESALTGESVPVSKTADTLERDLPLAERTNMLFKGTAITRGTGEGVVVATGMNTELGHISSLTASAKEEITPLEKRLDKLGQNLIWVTAIIVVLVAIAGILGGKDLYLMIVTAVALAVGAVPEGLPIVATVALARGMWRMAKRNALINRLSAVETLGATSIICTDKTGTLTENRMTVTQIVLESGEVQVTGEALEAKGEFTRQGRKIDPLKEKILRSALEVGVLCNNAHLPESSNDNAIGDPMEVALLVAGAKAGIHKEELLSEFPEVREVAFESETKMMATIHKAGDGYHFAVKGASESVLPACTHKLTPEGSQPMSQQDRDYWQERGDRMARDGLRILALAEKTVDNPDAPAYEQLTFLGILGLLDPPRQDAKAAIKECQQAGIRVIMLTGDQPITARQIGLAVGLTSEQEAEARLGKELKNPDELSDQEKLQLRQVPIFARVSPEQKLNLIAIHQQAGAVVAMTGDGVNDAPALKKADIGIAMGKRGTQVAREAADMVLQDDAFSTIVAAIEQGRAIFANIRKFTLYLLSGNTGQIIAVAVASIANLPLPLFPLQILFINAVNDVFPALALGVGEGNPQQMKHPPRPSHEPILTRRHWGAIAGYGIIIAATILGVFIFSLRVLGLEERRAVTISFLTLAFTRLWHVFNMRDSDSRLFRNEITQNRFIWLALLICTGLILIAVYVPFIAQVLLIDPPSLEQWGLILGMSTIPLLIIQIWKLFKNRKFRRIAV
ncbi:P-type ATPase, translocating [Pleurocapsa sp. PCC 7327]|uniref:cation-translocating P-type ATPase n=1 Tax=Pleurocapsa sp. PCC 7327 TaxID=118163 RepID=UPI00029F84CE|nr:cation-transporting P-type ATPase [Pleurocapsa sp. PCC 7327]AFY78983.1 P-type ATPase, translocating [Pleurocapsa sp. PCC 7327]